MRYIGSKKNLLPQIDKMISKHLTGKERTFMDLFAGTNVVGRYFKPRFQIISNDILSFCQVIAAATIRLNHVPTFTKLKEQGIHDPFQYLQMKNLRNYPGDFITHHYSPHGPANRMLFTAKNAKRIDFIRNTIQKWSESNWINDDERVYLLNALIEAVPSISNMTGTYAAYLKKWDPRAFKELELIPDNITDNGVTNESYQLDAIQLAKHKYVDIVYIDTPYNSRQYGSNYHVLETITRWDYPELHGKTGQRDTQNVKSDFARKREAKSAMEKLLMNVHAHHVCLSYSTDGIIPENELTKMIKDHAKEGTFDIMRVPYRKYKSKIVKKHSVEELIYYYQPQDHRTSSNNKRRMPKVKQNSTKLSNDGFIKSPFNYIGGKYKILSQIMPYFPEHITQFVDLFSGGCNVGINVAADKVYFNDINTKINDLFRYLQRQNIDVLISKIKDLINKYHLSKTNGKGFQDLRNDYNRNPTPLGLYVLVAYSFNYQFRFNNDLKYNNPFGKNRSHFSKQMEQHLIRFVNKLNTIHAQFTDEYFTHFDTSKLDAESFVYADPPYLITNGSYNDGNRGFVNWTTKQEKELYHFLDNLDRRHIKFALSNVLEHKGVKNDMLNTWSKSYHVHHLNNSYRNASYNTKKLTSDEVLITNY